MIKTWQAILASISLFVAGAITGGAIAVGVEQKIAAHQKAIDDQAQQTAQAAADAQRAAAQAQTDAQLAALSARVQAMQNARRGGGPFGQPGQQNQFGVQLMRRLMNKLSFTPEQKAQIGPVVRRTGEELARLRRETQMRTAVVIERTLDEIEDVLTPQQKTQFEDLLRDRRQLLQQLINQSPRRPGARGDGGPGNWGAQGNWGGQGAWNSRGGTAAPTGSRAGTPAGTSAGMSPDSAPGSSTGSASSPAASTPAPASSGTSE